jgi:hypothetical protein
MTKPKTVYAIQIFTTHGWGRNTAITYPTQEAADLALAAILADGNNMDVVRVAPVPANDPLNDAT